MSGTVSGAGKHGNIGGHSAPEPEVAKFHKLVNSDGTGGFNRNSNLKTLASDLHRLTGPS